jgi:hypothetical protein
MILYRIQNSNLKLHSLVIKFFPQVSDLTIYSDRLSSSKASFCINSIRQGR